MIWTITCRDDGHVAGEAARVVLDAVVASRGCRFALGLSGGRIAPRFYEELVGQRGRRGVGLETVEFFWADERCVPPDHAESNYGVARAKLLEPLGVGGMRVHRLEGELLPGVAADRANAEWEAFVRVRGAAGARLDCVVLGVGEDGHVASLFPGNWESDSRGGRAFRAVRGPKPPPDRLTMGYELLWEARLVVVLATGAGKERVVAEAVLGGSGTPLGRVIAGRGVGETVVLRSGKAI